MKKTLVIILAILFTFNVYALADSVPGCIDGYHFEGEVEETTVCETVCAARFFGWCLDWEEECETTSELIGSCVADEVEDEDDETVIDDTATSTEEGDEATSTDDEISTSTDDAIEEVSTPKRRSGNIFLLIPAIVTANYNHSVAGNSVIIGWMTNQFSSGEVLVKDEKGGIKVFQDNGIYTYHTVVFELPAGKYTVTPRSTMGYTTVSGTPIEIEVK